MNAENSNGAPRQECAAENQRLDSTSYVLLPPAGLECSVCLAGITGADLDSGLATLLPVVHAGEFSIAVGVCQECTSRAEAEDGSTDALFADIRANYLDSSFSAGETQESPDPVEASSPQLTLFRRPPRAHGRKHPAYGARLVAEPPPDHCSITVAIGWEHAKKLPHPLLVVQPDDQPASLRFDVAAGRAVRVAHPESTDPAWLLTLAQALIDEGAALVELVIFPPRAGATATESLRVVPEIAA